MSLPSSSILAHLVDVHCHPTDSPIPIGSIHVLPLTICAMSTRPADQDLVRALAKANPERVIPCFGYHPWFTHWVSLEGTPPAMEEHYRALFLPTDPNPELESTFASLLRHLPDPTPLSSLLNTLRENLTSHPTALLGEVGLDRAARIPLSFPAPGHSSSAALVLTPFTIPLAHQLAVLEAQLGLAVELGRAVSLHSVKAQAATKELIERMRARYGARWVRVSVDLHSCGMSAEMCRDIQNKHPNVYLSLSTVINSRSPAHRALIASCAPSRLLVESDINHIDMCASRTWEMVQTVAEVKGWRVEKEWDYPAEDGNEEAREAWGVVKRLEANWQTFHRGGHSVSPKKDKKARTRTQGPPEA